MEPEGSSPQSQVSATCPYPEPDPVHTRTSYWMKSSPRKNSSVSKHCQRGGEEEEEEEEEDEDEEE
jgi:hypothetical protein